MKRVVTKEVEESLRPTDESLNEMGEMICGLDGRCGHAEAAKMDSIIAKEEE